ncbi:MAG: hypothetical protein FD143_3031 [Ignavibacteria bacterium]|nr:MAG: hypothetical protein FD143_3031 [Ignavibacteria bacterium]
MRNLMGLPCNSNSSTTWCSTIKSNSSLSNDFSEGMCSIQDPLAKLARKHHMHHHYDEWMPATKNKWATVPTSLDTLTDDEMQLKGVAKTTLEFVDETDDDATIMV